MPVQSGSDRVLKRMIRRYTVAEYVERIELLRARVPGVTVSTDIIVGFPGETAEDFERTLDLVHQVRFVGVFGFKYSVRPYTPALRLEDDVPEEEKAARLAALFAAAEAERRAHLERCVGTPVRVLVEGPGKEPGAYTGRTERNEIVHFTAANDPTGTLVELTVVRAFKNSLEATFSGDAPAPARPPEPRLDARRLLPVL
jgi:tRNA-2-methylthio-N6-dimethylallyladenosine synthase